MNYDVGMWYDSFDTKTESKLVLRGRHWMKIKCEKAEIVNKKKTL